MLKGGLVLIWALGMNLAPTLIVIYTFFKLKNHKALKLKCPTMMKHCQWID